MYKLADSKILEYVMHDFLGFIVLKIPEKVHHSSIISVHDMLLQTEAVNSC